MDAEHILEMMNAYFQSTKPDETLGNLGACVVTDVLTSSFDVMEFVMHLEEVLELDEDIDLEVLGPKFAQNLTFSQLALEIKKYLEPET